MTQRRLTLEVLEDRFAVCRYSIDGSFPFPKVENGFFSWTCNADEISVVCREEAAPEEAEVEKGWRGLRIAGQLDFHLIGILASLTAPLAEAEIGVYVISTFSTDFVFVKANKLDEAIRALQDGGFEFRTPDS
ncbi:MAG TPA: ACT domain-containing protein [Acidobacteriota bacterium]|nr:ACT domain-containing protein [Acidobacteriota bacterium]